jgi:hypothetical protein
VDLQQKLAEIAAEDDVSVDMSETGSPEAESPEIEASASETLKDLTPTEEVQPEAVTEEVAEEEVAAEGAETAEEAQEWTPSLKYKMLKEEHDFPEWTKEFVKSKEIEEQFVDLLTKATGLEHQKKRRGEVEDQFATLKAEHESKMEDARQLAHIVQSYNQKMGSKDPAEQLRALTDSGLTEQGLLDIARHVLEVQKLSPQQQQAYRQQFDQREQLNQYQQQLSQTQAGLQQAQQASARAELTSFLSSKADIVKEYEAVEGNKEGDFQSDFVSFGIALEQKLGKDVEWSEAYKQFKKIHGLGKPKSKPAPKTLPKLKSVGASPIEASIRTMDDFRQLNQEIQSRKGI